jgi:cell wall-associated NlpC family hydrolase
MITQPSYYSTTENIDKLKAATKALVGTPFFGNSEAPGRDGGIDCVRSLNWLHRTCGAIGRIEIPRYPVDWGQHSERSLLIEAFETLPELKARFVKVWERTTEEEDDTLDAVRADMLPGDTVCFTSGKVPHHGGVITADYQLLHTLRQPGVHAMKLTAVIRGVHILGKLAAVYRPIPRA